MSAAEAWSIGIDVGGTYVDVAAVEQAGGYRRCKIPRAAADPARSVLMALDEALPSMAIAPQAVRRIAHGSTLVTNMLLERKAPPVAVVTNRGFTDILSIGRQNRRDLYAPVTAPQTPADLFPDRLRFGITGRCDAHGHEIAPLDPAELAALAGNIAATGAGAVAICLLHATRNPAHELAVARALSEAQPDLALSLSHTVDVAAGEFERFLATALDAYVKPPTRTYLAAFRDGLRVRGLPEPAIMTSDAGLRPLDEVADSPLCLALAGPAAAMSGFSRQAKTDAQDDAACISIETGGTTTDIGLIEAGNIVCGRRVELGGLSVRLRSTDVLSVPVGGGSIVQVNAAGALRLGPHSAGSLPGPAAYGRGGSLPTLTDALVVLGRLPARLAGGLVLDVAAAHRVIAGIAAALGCDGEAAARAIVATAATAIAEGVKAHAYRHGLDPSGGQLIAGGGGGAQHAAEVADLLGCDRVLVPTDAGVVSALGCLASPEMAAAEVALDLQADPQGWPAVLAAVQHVLNRAGENMDIAWSLEAVYQGQSAALEMPFAPERDTPGAAAQRFHSLHARVRGHGFDRPVRLLRLRGEWSRRTAVLAAMPESTEVGTAKMGPLAIFTETTSLWLPASWSCRPGPDGSLLLQRIDAADRQPQMLKRAAR